MTKRDGQTDRLQLKIGSQEPRPGRFLIFIRMMRCTIIFKNERECLLLSVRAFMIIRGVDSSQLRSAAFWIELILFVCQDLSVTTACFFTVSNIFVDVATYLLRVAALQPLLGFLDGMKSKEDFFSFSQKIIVPKRTMIRAVHPCDCRICEAKYCVTLKTIISNCKSIITIIAEMLVCDDNYMRN